MIHSNEEIGNDESKELIVKQAKATNRTFMLEPSLGTEGKIKTRCKGVGNFEVIIKEKPFRAGLTPVEGPSAILGLSHIVQQLFQLNDPANGITVNAGTIKGGERSNVIAAKSKVMIDVRVPSKEAGEVITKKIGGLKSEIEDIELFVKDKINSPPWEKEPHKRLGVNHRETGRGT